MKWKRILLKSFVFFSFFICILFTFIYFYIILSPKMDLKKTNNIIIYDKDDNVIYKGNGSKEWISLKLIDKDLINATISIEDKNMQYEVAQMIFDNDMSVRQTEEYVKRLKNPKPEEKQEPKKDAKTEARLAAYKEKENEMKQILKTNVTIDDKGNKGRIVINYSNLEEFERIFEWIQK